MSTFIENIHDQNRNEHLLLRERPSYALNSQSGEVRYYLRLWAVAVNTYKKNGLREQFLGKQLFSKILYSL